MKYFLLLLIATNSIYLVKGQCGMQELSLKDRCAESTLIIEGKVIGKDCFWDAPHKNIYTKNRIEVYTLFKGKLNAEMIDIITEGGVVDNDMDVVSNSLSLMVKDRGIFLLKPSNVKYALTSEQNIVRYEAVAATQGFVQYNVNNQTASDLFHTYDNIKTNVFKSITNYSQQKMRILKNEDLTKAVDNQNEQQKNVNSLAITSFIPTTITAGTKSILTISGSGFGISQGLSTVGFKSADNAGSTYINPDATEYISWSDSEIKLYVPYKAGTGTIQVTIGTVTTSSSTLTVPYSQTNMISSGAYQAYLVGMNNNKEYTWQYNVNFNTNANAKSAFLRALTTWRCGSFVNWQIDTINTTAIDISATDLVNVITFDSSNPLPAGVVGRCTSHMSSCATGIWYVKDLDIVFSATANWNYSTSTSFTNTDFESFALHELGHGQQLGHVINPADVMHYSISTGTFRRTLSQNNLDCANNVMAISTSTAFCSRPKMVALTSTTCQIGSVATGIDDVNTQSFLVFPNPGNGNMQINYSIEANQKAVFEIYDILGHKLYYKELKNNEVNVKITDCDLVSGIYFYQVLLNDKIARTDKLLIVR